MTQTCIGEIKFGDWNVQCHRYACFKFKLVSLFICLFVLKNSPNHDIINLANNIMACHVLECSFYKWGCGTSILPSYSPYIPIVSGYVLKACYQCSVL